MSTFSKPARDMFAIAIKLAGFDRTELFLEICRRQRGRGQRINEPTVLNAMQAIVDRDRAGRPEAYEDYGCR